MTCLTRRNTSLGLLAAGLQLLSARTARDPADVVAVGTLLQVTPGAYVKLGLPSDPDPVPKDLEGKTVGVQAGSEYVVTALARKNGIDPSKIRIVTVQASAEPLLVGSVDFFGAWVTNQTYQVEQEAAKPDAPAALKGKTWKALRVAQWGLPAFADVIFCTRRTAEQHPELVTSYLRAVSRAISFILSNPQEAIDLVAAYPGQIEDPKKLAWRWKVQNPLYVSAVHAEKGPLWMDAAVWDDMSQFLLDNGQIPRAVPASEMMTNDLLPHPATL